MAFEPISTQEEFDAAIKARLERERAKFSDYDELKEKAEAARKRVEELEQAEEARKGDEKRRAALDKVAKETGVPAELISGDDEESMAASAKAIAEFAKAPAAPQMGEAGKFAGEENGKGGAAGSMKEVVDQLFG